MTYNSIFWFLSMIPVIGFVIAVITDKKVLIWVFNATITVIFWIVIVAIGAGENTKFGTNSMTEPGSCDKGGVYSKQFNCQYVFDNATYDVYYWRYLNDNKSERYVGTTVGLSACRDVAIDAHRDANNIMNQSLEWSERMYVCMLTKDGRNLEKHRLFN